MRPQIIARQIVSMDMLGNGDVLRNRADRKTAAVDLLAGTKRRPRDLVTQRDILPQRVMLSVDCDDHPCKSVSSADQNIVARIEKQEHRL